MSIVPRASRSAKITDLRSLERLEKYTALLFSLTKELCKVLPRKPVGGGVGIERYQGKNRQREEARGGLLFLTFQSSLTPEPAAAQTHVAQI